MYVVIENMTAGKKFKCVLPQELSYKRESLVDAFTMPEADDDETELTKLEGVSGRVELGWMMKDSTEDLSMGTEPGGVRTIEEQFVYTSKVIVTAAFDDSWTVTLYKDESTVVDSWTGAFETFSISIDVGARTMRGSATLVVGEVV